MPRSSFSYSQTTVMNETDGFVQYKIIQFQSPEIINNIMQFITKLLTRLKKISPVPLGSSTVRTEPFQKLYNR
jgi:hypothetical protein